MTIGEFVERYSICDGGSAAAKGESHRDVKEAWEHVDKASWLFWMVSRARVDQKKLVKAACACAREALPLVPAGEGRPQAAIEAAEGWAEGKVEKAKVLEAARASMACSQSLDSQSAGHIAAFACFEAANTVKTALRTPGVCLAICAAFAAAGKGTVEEKDVDLSPILRKYVSWSDVQAAFDGFKAQPKEDYELVLPSVSSDERVLNASTKQMEQVDALLGQAEEIKQRYVSILKEHGLEPSFIAGVKNAPVLGTAGSSVVMEVASALDEEEAPAKTSTVSKRARTMI